MEGKEIHLRIGNWDHGKPFVVIHDKRSGRDESIRSAKPLKGCFLLQIRSIKGGNGNGSEVIRNILEFMIKRVNICTSFKVDTGMGSSYLK